MAVIGAIETVVAQSYDFRVRYSEAGIAPGMPV
jgi:hypothetical protein